MLYGNTKAMVHSPDSNTDFFGIVARILQGDTLVCIYIYLDYVLQKLIDLMKENDFTLKKARNRRYSIETITDTV